MEIKRTATTIFIVPTLKIDKDNLRNNGFINGYIADKNSELQYENAAFLLFKPENLEKFMNFVDGEYERTPTSLVDDYDCGEGYVVLVYELNQKFIQDYNLIKQGKYSKTSKAFQDLFPKTVVLYRNGYEEHQMSLQHRVFNKSADLKAYWHSKIDQNIPDELEFWDEFNVEKETLDISRIKETI